MKARIRKTGEIVDIVSYNHFSTIRSSQDYVSYIDSNGVEHDRESLNYYWDFEPIEENTINNEHWQDIRERAAIAAMQGILSHEDYVTDNRIREYSRKQQIEAAVNYANLLVEELKKENN